MKIENAGANNYSPENSGTGKQCPLCGKPISEEGIFCSNCLEISKKRESLKVVPEKIEQQTQPVPVAAEPAIVPEPKMPEIVRPADSSSKGNKRYFFIFLSGIILCLAMGSVFFFVRKNTKTELKTELNFWYSCIEKNTPATYSAYLREYPQGKFIQDALLKIGELRETEHIEWEKVRKTTDIDEYAGFLQAYPDTPFGNEAKKIMDSLSWIIASTGNTVASYNDYLEKIRAGYLTGFYEGVARERYDYLSQIRELDQPETELVRETMDRFFRTLSKQEYKNMDRFFGKIITNFYGAKNRTTMAIISSIEADMKKNRIKSLTYTLDFDSLQAYKNGDGLIVTEITVKKKIAYRHKKTVETIDETLCIDFNPDMRIKSLYVKGKEN